MLTVLKSILIFLVVLLPLRLVGILLLIPVCAFYRLGQFPKLLRWFDDYKEVYLNQIADTDFRRQACHMYFGKAHCDLVDHYNKTALRRYLWAAHRNAVNTFKYTMLGSEDYENAKEIKALDGDMLQISGTNFYIRYRFGHKTGDHTHNHTMKLLGIPLEFACSVGIRRGD